MGNNSSGNVGIQQPPPPWTQSLPRDVHRQKKYGAIQGAKVLPERIPGQRLRPTENGRNLQTQGTISPRKIAEVASLMPNYPPPLINHHHSSMTALNHPQNHSINQGYSQNSGPFHDLRFGYPPNKSFTSEPDLRGASPSSHLSLPASPPNNLPHTVISQSPMKGKIKSKKRHKAPLPPHPLQASISLPLERYQSVPSAMSNENWSTASSPTPRNLKPKPKKIGLFKKRTETRMSKYETDSPLLQNGLPTIDYSRGEDRLKNGMDRSTTPVPLKISSKKELKERARSLDNLQHEIRRSPKDLATSMHNLGVIGSIPPSIGKPWLDADQNNRNSDSSESKRCSTIERDSRSKSKEKLDTRGCTTLDRESKSHRRISNVERRLYERQLEERRLEDRVSSPIRGTKITGNNHSRVSTDYKRSSSSCSSYREYHEDKPQDEWDKAEEEWLNRKHTSDKLQKEILSATKNLRKTSKSPDPTNEIKINFTNSHEIQERSEVFLEETEPEEVPKTFYFGMEPEPFDKNKFSNINSALGKLHEDEIIKINGNTVEYSRHSLRPKEKRKSLERDTWNRSLDYRERSRSRNKEIELDDNADQLGDKRLLTRKIGEFAATIERVKSQRVHSPEELSNSISRKGDGGYHSRQNSGSVHLDTEGSDEDNMIRMNLRPTLPRRQLELPRFSPNAAWRSLSVETPSRQKEIYNDVHVNDDVFNVSEDRIHRFTRPTAPPRGSGEKSADSGISGDAGSPGPIQEFEPLTPEKLKSSSGPLAVSSPVVSARLDTKRTWIPAQDLDDNSFEESADQNIKSSVPQEVPALPKLTSRSNMFTMSFQNNDICGIDEVDYGRKHKYSSVDPVSESEAKQKDPKHKSYVTNVESRNISSLQRVQSAVSSPNEYEDNRKRNVNEKSLQEEAEDLWRENWSMSRSIPNSLNTCEEVDAEGNVNRSCRSRSESRMSSNNVLIEVKGQQPGSRPITPSYLQRGNNGHIVYLPEYKSYQIDKTHLGDSTRMTYLATSEEVSTNKDMVRNIPLSMEENCRDPDANKFDKDAAKSQNCGNPIRGFSRENVGRKNKKFSYQSTVRILEKKKLEEKLSKEAEEEERRRLREVEAMMKVEQEFQKKREREKKRLKKQLKLYQEDQGGQRHSDRNSSSSSEEKGFSPKAYDHPPLERIDIPSHYSERVYNPPLPFAAPPPQFQNGYHMSSSYQSLPMELQGDPLPYEPHGSHHQNQQGLFSGLKKWVKNKKESRSGYLSDASSVTVTSSSRQDPDGAPAAFSSRKNNIRAEIIAASRHRNGVIHMDPSLDHHSSRSPVTSVTSKGSHRRPYTPDSKRTISPDSRKSLSSEPLTQELPEMKQEQRQYREYRSSKKMLIPNMFKGNNHKAVPISHNYRRDFCLGNTPIKIIHHQDDGDKHSRHSNESRMSKHSLVMTKQTDFFDTQDSSSSKDYHLLASSKPPIPLQGIRGAFDPVGHRPISRIVNVHSSPSINSSPARFAQGIITPFNPSKGYRPVSFSPPPSGKILTVT